MLTKEEIIQICQDSLTVTKLGEPNTCSFKLYFEMVADKVIDRLKEDKCENCEHNTYCNKLADTTNGYRVCFDLDFSCKYFMPKGGRND
jgi:hypothetical protein